MKLDEANIFLNCLREPAILLSPEYRILCANQSYQSHYANSSVILGKHCYEVSHNYDRPCNLSGESCPMDTCRETKQPHRVLHLHYTPKGREHVEVETIPLKDNQGNIQFFVEIMRHPAVASTQPGNVDLVGTAPAFNRMLALLQRVAPTLTTVLLLGESGTGKELVAKAVHDSSHLEGPLVPVECSGLSETLFESELFGHRKGAFTGAFDTKTGLVEAAHGGTLFLDEIGDIPLNLQVKLLRLLETGTYRRVGEVEPRQANFRLVCATHRKLNKMVEKGKFRQDLYYRISAFPIHLPALRERMEDLPLLVETLLKRIVGQRELKASETTLECLKHYAFPGNIRELRNILERASLLADGDSILAVHLPDTCQTCIPTSKPPFFGEKIIPLETLERDYLQWAQCTHSGDRASLAEQLGMSERTLYRKLKGLES
ncbi:sigma-54 interaction domain-containing protein [Candidatus Venteria ishoeyi]|uniref:Transcriptional regulatory protein ZraR n=1 Tax=Candidatus Venteria ishoeyi TaxID=1899563 RepID=A0A1H6FF78_9GAMM|nr:sigma-54-dependent Fis family transcriptional regulator [Candidatus Venteria ishoeyi]MDM8546478.1 sigma 54-interacting transcriptional regulator [Candidatus Venteria ishoeyi]SEH08071.1 Transcriptional regulatory protein ZraR [Candidatus Venteria ishoeyi]